MTLTLNLPPELEHYLAQEAKQQRLSVGVIFLTVAPSPLHHLLRLHVR